MLDREAALRQLAWALHLILAGKTASVNSRQDRVISSCEDECFASSGTYPREDYSLYILHIHLIYSQTQIYNGGRAEKRADVKRGQVKFAIQLRCFMFVSYNFQLLNHFLEIFSK